MCRPLLCDSLRSVRAARLLLTTVALAAVVACAAQTKPTVSEEPDVLVLSNGDTLHGRFINEIGGTVKFHSEALGDISLKWDKIRELRTQKPYAVIPKDVKLLINHTRKQVPVGKLEMTNGEIKVHATDTEAPATVPVKSTQYILEEATMDRLVNHQPNLFSAWNGQATMGAALVSATQRQYTVSGGIGLVRVVPTVSWLKPRNRTSLDFTGSFGKIIQPGYFSTSQNAYVPELVTKSAIYHADAERDEYFSPRFYAIAQTAFDHNFSQSLDLQQIYGGGIGWTALKTPRQEGDLKATIQYEKQLFIPSASNTDPSANTKNLVGSTFSANYRLQLSLLTFTQGVAFIPSYNQPHAYSVNETNTVSFPAYKNLSFTLGTMDSYLNNPPTSEPPTQRNSFQFTMGLTYAIRSNN